MTDTFPHLAKILSVLYYMCGALAFLAGAIRVLYGWFRDYDSAIQFTADMAKEHLPYLNECLQTIADQVGAKLPPPPAITFSKNRPRL